MTLIPPPGSLKQIHFFFPAKTIDIVISIFAHKMQKHENPGEPDQPRISLGKLWPPVHIKIFILRNDYHMHKSEYEIIENDQTMPQVFLPPYLDQTTQESRTRKTGY
ncbi:hypothetical protein N5F23_08620 [Pseudomonas sichuanensis]|uniref:hypothetical protein n=1 Tax=Pseudomonas sichuanensis TaxID=2213015 RepID=UPI00244A7D2C|nr:hypothetical protein [Pseudomonas sichuanensis]MDH0733071.1 hypothetical protein [Pseudomonas sichuanensis]MDH1582655.1 hypothetical protein [Pseudomonas sichuanensis]MDH1592568.1 hypothetical protein [Pseudomonas sichuanensis]MDH1597680.1 hypothetical protein [Pseudomonas sichuanensis]